MTASNRLRPLRRGLGLAFGALVVLAAPHSPLSITTPAWAQSDGAPLSLFPQPDAAPGTTGPGSPGAGTGIQVLPADPVLRPSTDAFRGIEVRDLGGPDPDATGLLGPGTGGLGQGMWQSTSQDVALDLLQRLPVAASSRAMQDLMRRLLLSTATPPVVTRPGQAAEGGILTPLRIDRLFAMGRLDDVARFVAALPADSRTPALERHRTDALLLVGQTDAACETAMAANEEDDDPYWQKVLVFCDLLAGRADQAALGMSLLREMGHEDGVFFKLAETLGGLSDSPPKTVEVPDALVIALYRATNLPLPAEYAETALPWVDLAVALTGSAEPLLRLQTGERAEAAGALPSDALRFMYADMPFPEEAYARPLSEVAGVTSPENRALLLQMASDLNSDAERARALSIGLYTARASGATAYLTLSRALGPLMRSVPPDPRLTADGTALARALYAADDLDAAQAWIAALTVHVETNRVVADALEELKLFNAMAEGQTVTLPWPTPQGDGEPGSFDPVVLDRLYEASSRGAVAETVALAMIAIGPGGPTAAHGQSLDAALKALHRVGLRRAAGAIALEAALTRWTTNS
ncbi:MAG: hypothetical protein ACPGYL_01350, partial [Rhodospirillaceae bacterium]